MQLLAKETLIFPPFDLSAAFPRFVEMMLVKGGVYAHEACEAKTPIAL